MAQTPLSIRIARVVVTVVGALLFFIVPLVTVIILSLAIPHSPLVGIWAGKPDGFALFKGLGLVSILFLAILGILALVTGIGLLQRRRWARWVTVVLLGLNALPDLAMGFLGNPETLLAAVPVAVLVIYLALPVVGRALRPRADKREN